MRDLCKENWTWYEELPEKKKGEWMTSSADVANATTFVRQRHIPVTEKIAWTSSWIPRSQHTQQLPILMVSFVAKTRLAPVSPKTMTEL